MKRREEIAEETRKGRDKLVLADYMKRDKDGRFIMSVKEIASKYKISVPLVYKILEKHDKSSH